METFNVADIKFNFDTQEWVDQLTKKVVPEQPGWDHVCRYCKSPAAITSYDAHYEYYLCLACEKQTRVN